MARMYPERATIEADSRAEHDLYGLLRDQLPNDYVVFHSVRWQQPRRGGGVYHGEADFIIAHPSRGILVVEVKGGRIEFDGRLGQWYTNRKPLDRDPAKQANDNMYDLKRKLEGLPFWARRMPTLGFALAFPDSEVQGDLRLDIPKTIVMDWRDRPHVRAWVDRVMAYHHRPGRDQPMGEAGLAQLIDVLSPSRQILHPMAADFQAEREQILHLTEEQFRVLDILAGVRRAAVSGCAGSGKTTLALYKARKLGEQGFRVLLTCFNTHLARYLGSAENLPKGVEVLTFHGVRRKLVAEAGLRQRGLRSDWLTDSQVDQAWNDLLLEAVDTLGPRYDAIIVDEGRDFHPDWWDALQCLLPDLDHGILYVFYDDNQNLYQRPLSLPAGLLPIPLSENRRNTQHIHRAFLPFYRGERQPVAKGPAGRPVEVFYYDSEDGLKKHLQSVLHHLTVKERVPPEDIVILTPRSQGNSAIWRWGRLGNLRVTADWGDTSNAVYSTSVYGFKGLESPVIILAELYPTTHQDLEALLYVGCSRACHHLVIIADMMLPQDIFSRLPPPKEVSIG